MTVPAGISKVQRAEHHWQQFGAFVAYLRRRFDEDQCTRAAASLAYTSLLAMVPLFTVIFVTISAFPSFQEWREAIETFVFRNFVPALGDQVRSYLVQFAEKAKGLQAAGVLVLVVTVLAMMSTIESTFNVIWRIKRKRPFMIRFLMYWSVLTLGPVLIGASMVATSYIVSLPLLSDVGFSGSVRIRFISMFPMLATTLAFVLFFKLIPYRPVPTRHALVGGIVASGLFELAKQGFALYVTNFPAQQAIYGAFATVPVFLIWIYLSWVVVLLGAEITQCLTTFRALAPRRHGAIARRDPMFCAFRVLYRLYLAQLEGRGVAEKELMKAESDFDYGAINGALEVLDVGGWISRNDVFQWVLMRDLHRLTLLDLLHLVPSFTPLENVASMNVDAADQHLQAKLIELGAWSGMNLNVALADLMSADDDAAEDAPVSAEHNSA